MRYKNPKKGNMSRRYLDQNICMKKKIPTDKKKSAVKKLRGTKMSWGRNVQGPKCLGAEMSGGRNVQVPKRPWGQNVQVPKRPWCQNIRAETSFAEILRAET